MCIPIAIAATVAAVAGVASTGLQAYGAYQNGKVSKEQAKVNAAQSQMQAQLANFNADQAELYGDINAKMVTTISGINNKLTAGVSATNVALIGATTDFNVGIIKATTDFNVSSATGAAALLRAQGEAESQTHSFNALLDESQAQDALDQGAQQERASRAGYAKVKGQQRAALAANGVTLDEGSALRIQSDTDYASDTDAATIKTNTLKQALGYRIQGASETMSARMASLNGEAAAQQEMMKAVSAKINGEVAVTQATTDASVKTLDNQMTASFQILQSSMDAEVQAMSIKNQATSDAFNFRAAALGYTGQAAQATLTANSIHPGLMAGTSLLAGASQLAGSYASMSQAGVFGKGNWSF